MDGAGRQGLARPADPRQLNPQAAGCVSRSVRRAVPFAIVAGCLGVGVLPALAADGSVAIHDGSFSPSQVAVMPGESVTWQAAGTTQSHNVHFDGEAAAVGMPSTSFSGSRQFPAEGTFRYHCDVHAS